MISGNGNQFIWYSQHTSGTWNDEVLEGETHYIEEAGVWDFYLLFVIKFP